jgi:hypothetical protein
MCGRSGRVPALRVELREARVQRGRVGARRLLRKSTFEQRCGVAPLLHLLEQLEQHVAGGAIVRVLLHRRA